MKLTAPLVRGHKRRTGPPLVMVTAYDEPGARFASEAGVDLILVGDSLANVVLGHRDTLHVSVEEMCHHVPRRVAARSPTARGGGHAVVELSLSVAESVRNAARLDSQRRRQA